MAVLARTIGGVSQFLEQIRTPMHHDYAFQAQSLSNYTAVVRSDVHQARLRSHEGTTVPE